MIERLMDYSTVYMTARERTEILKILFKQFRAIGFRLECHLSVVSRPNFKSSFPSTEIKTSGDIPRKS